MPWFKDWLGSIKKLLKISDESSLINGVKITDNKTINNTYNIDNRKQILIIHPNNLPKGVDAKFKELLKEAEENGELLFDNKKTEVLREAVLYQDHSEDDQLLLKFFKDIIPKQDFKALEEALFLRYEFKKGRNIDTLKHEIRMKYGERGNNIANLCSADYFDVDLKEIYNENPKEFHKIYDLMVGKEGYTLFVSRQMTVPETTEKIEAGLKQAKRYGIENYQIHGIGKKNISKVEKAIKKLKGGKTKFVDKNVYREKDIIIVQLLV